MPRSRPRRDDLAPLAEGRYRLDEILGVGGMATVYRGLDTRLRVPRAIKVLNPLMARSTSLRSRFEAEARTMARLEHRNIVRVYDVGVDEDRVFIVMELLEGGSLVDRLEAAGPLPPRQALDVTIDILGALELAHGAGVVHRDIKPHNVLMTSKGEIRVSDFGIAHVRDADDDHLTKTGTTMGTWGFMSPEQRSNARGVDGRADLYATGATLYACLVNDAPMDLFAADLDPNMLAAVPPVLADVVRKATRYDRNERYENAAEMAAALLALREALPSVPDDAPSLARPPSRAGVEASPLSALRPSTSAPGLHAVREPQGPVIVGQPAQVLEVGQGAGPTVIPDSYADSTSAPVQELPAPMEIAEPAARSAPETPPETLPPEAPAPSGETLYLPSSPPARPSRRLVLVAAPLLAAAILLFFFFAFPGPGRVDPPEDAGLQRAPIAPERPDGASISASVEPPPPGPPVETPPASPSSSSPEPRASRAERKPDPSTPPAVTPATSSATDPVVSASPPAIEHTPIRQARVGETLNVECRVTRGRYKVNLYHRPAVGGAAYSRRLMTGQNGYFSATLPVTAADTAGIEYYILASAEESGLEDLKKGSGFSPFKILVSP